MPISRNCQSAPSAKAAAEALAAATMASSAMPVFHQQLRVAGSDERALTLYDGGVRRSVFFDRAMAAVDREVRKQMQGHPVARVAGGATQAAIAQDYEETAPPSMSCATARPCASRRSTQARSAQERAARLRPAGQ